MREEEKQFHINIKNEVGGVLASFFCEKCCVVFENLLSLQT